MVGLVRTYAEPITAGFLHVTEVAEALHVTTATLQRWIREGRLPAVRLGRLTLIPRDALRIAIDRQEARNDP